MARHAVRRNRIGARRVTFLGLIWHSLWSRRARSIGLALAVAIGVMTVVTWPSRAAASSSPPRR